MNSNWVDLLKKPGEKLYKIITREEPTIRIIDTINNVYENSLQMKKFTIENEKAKLTPKELEEEAKRISHDLISNLTEIRKIH